MKKLKRGKKSGLVYFNIKDIRSWNPCYDPNKYLPEDFRGTATDILKHPAIPFADKLWVVCRNEICSDKLMRLFAVFCARDALSKVKDPDPRSIEAVDVAERFANGQATERELDAARSAARSARSAVRSAAESAVRSAACSAAWYAAWSAAKSVRSAAQDRYRDKLIEMIEIEGKKRNKD